MSFWFYCAAIYFWFHLLNHSDLGAPVRDWTYPRVGRHVSYALSCAFCLTWWITLFAVCGQLVPIGWAFGAPVVNLFALKLFNYLSVADRP